MRRNYTDTARHSPPQTLTEPCDLMQSFGPRNRLFRPPAGSRSILEGEALDLPKKTAEWTRFSQRRNVRRAAGTRSRCRPVHIQAYKGFGIIPTPTSFAEVFTAMQQGTVDG